MVLELLLRSVAAELGAPSVNRRPVAAACALNGEPFTAELDVPVPSGMQLVDIAMLGHQTATHP